VQSLAGTRYSRCGSWILERPKGASPEGRGPEDEALRGKAHLQVSCGPASSSKYRPWELWNYLLMGLGNLSGLPRNISIASIAAGTKRTRSCSPTTLPSPRQADNLFFVRPKEACWWDSKRNRRTPCVGPASLITNWKGHFGTARRCGQRSTEFYEKLSPESSRREL
jgi:hypothetical protein